MSITGQFGCGHRPKFAPLEDGVGERFHTNSKYTLSCLLPATLPFQISQPAKICLKNRYFEEQIHWVPLPDVVHKVYETVNQVRYAFVLL